MAAATTAAAIAFDSILKNTTKKNVPNGTLDACIKNAMEEHSVPAGIKISAAAVRIRVKRGNLEGLKTQTPMLAVEKTLVGWCIAAKHLNFPLSHARFLDLANSIIRGTDIEQNVIDFKVKNLGFTDTGQGAQLGKKYYQNFMKRHAAVLQSVKVHKFDAARVGWCTYGNFRLMYNSIYTYMIEAGITENLPEPAYFDKDGAEVLTVDKAFGLICEALVTHAECLVAVNEAGTNTNQFTDSSNLE